MTELRYWTDADIAELRALWRSGVRIPDIGQTLNRTVFSIRRQAFRMGLAKRPPSKLKAFKVKTAPSAQHDRDVSVNAGNRDEDHIATCLAEGGFFISPAARDEAREVFKPRKAA